eukprot:GHVO01029077.1.p1 GENE.GHVO01029077.1~~GHVO01029077.1.p1  ORF type:complete len:402 (+),score=125.44 GHVO01029077.1:133-1338(+)
MKIYRKGWLTDVNETVHGELTETKQDKLMASLNLLQGLKGHPNILKIHKIALMHHIPLCAVITPYVGRQLLRLKMDETPPVPYTCDHLMSQLPPPPRSRVVVMSEVGVRHVAIGLLRALGHLETQQVTHRDVSPFNVCVSGLLPKNFFREAKLLTSEIPPPTSMSPPPTSISPPPTSMSPPPTRMSSSPVTNVRQSFRNVISRLSSVDRGDGCTDDDEYEAANPDENDQPFFPMRDVQCLWRSPAKRNRDTPISTANSDSTYSPNIHVQTRPTDFSPGTPHMEQDIWDTHTLPPITWQSAQVMSSVVSHGPDAIRDGRLPPPSPQAVAVTLIDFSESQPSLRSVEDGALGTPFFIPPECHIPSMPPTLSKRITHGPARDLWAAGAVLCALATGYPPLYVEG